MAEVKWWGERPAPADVQAWAILGWYEYFQTIEGEWGPYGLADFERAHMQEAPDWLLDGVRKFQAEEIRKSAELSRRLRHLPPDSQEPK